MDRTSLDRHITGNYGEDQFSRDEPSSMILHDDRGREMGTIARMGKTWVANRNGKPAFACSTRYGAIEGLEFIAGRECVEYSARERRANA